MPKSSTHRLLSELARPRHRAVARATAATPCGPACCTGARPRPRRSTSRSVAEPTMRRLRDEVGRERPPRTSATRTRASASRPSRRATSCGRLIQLGRPLAAAGPAPARQAAAGRPSWMNGRKLVPCLDGSDAGARVRSRTYRCTLSPIRSRRLAHRRLGDGAQVERLGRGLAPVEQSRPQRVPAVLGAPDDAAGRPARRAAGASTTSACRARSARRPADTARPPARGSRSARSPSPRTDMRAQPRVSRRPSSPGQPEGDGRDVRHEQQDDEQRPGM